MEVVSVVLGPVLLATSLSAMGTQTLRVLKRGTTEGVSLSTTMLGMMSNGAWITYGITNADPLQVLNNGPAGIGAFLIMLTAWRTGHLTRRRIPVLAVLAFALVTALLMAVFGPVGMGAVLTILTFTGKLPQVWKAWRAPGGEGLSVSAFGLTIAAAAGWALYGGLHGQHAVLGSGLYGIATTSFMLVRTVQGRRVEVTAPQRAFDRTATLQVA